MSSVCQSSLSFVFSSFIWAITNARVSRERAFDDRRRPLRTKPEPQQRLQWRGTNVRDKNPSGQLSRWVPYNGYIRHQNDHLSGRKTEISVMGESQSAGEPCACREKFGPRPIFKIFSLGQICVDQEKKEVRKRRASIHRSSPSDAVDYFLVSHVTGWAILGYPALELDTGIFPFVFFLDRVLPRSSNLILKKKCHTGKASLVQGVRVWFRLATRLLERQSTLAPFYRCYK